MMMLTNSRESGQHSCCNDSPSSSPSASSSSSSLPRSSALSPSWNWSCLSRLLRVSPIVVAGQRLSSRNSKRKSPFIAACVQRINDDDNANTNSDSDSDSGAIVASSRFTGMIAQMHAFFSFYNANNYHNNNDVSYHNKTMCLQSCTSPPSSYWLVHSSLYRTLLAMKPSHYDSHHRLLNQPHSHSHSTITSNSSDTRIASMPRRLYPLHSFRYINNIGVVLLLMLLLVVILVLPLLVGVVALLLPLMLLLLLLMWSLVHWIILKRAAMVIR